MANYKLINPAELSGNPFQLIGKDWMLVTAKNDDKINTMTASWGGMGVMWGKNVAVTVLRPQRCTKKFVDNTDSFTLTFYPESFRDDMMYVGRHSGNDEPDKIDHTNLVPAEIDGQPYFEGATLIMVCKKLYAQDMDPAGFIDETLDAANYAAKDYHTMYVAEVVKCYVAE